MKSPYLDGVLYNTREILNPLDDSVARVFRGAPQLIRRSRGYVPLPVVLAKPSARRPVFAAGGDLKSCFCLLSGDRAYLSQYFGDLESYGVRKNYRDGLERMERIFGIVPAVVAATFIPDIFLPRLRKKKRNASVQEMVSGAAPPRTCGFRDGGASAGKLHRRRVRRHRLRYGRNRVGRGIPALPGRVI